MDTAILKQWQPLLKDFLLLLVALFIAFIISRWYEFGLLFFYHGWEVIGTEYVASSIINDFQTSVLFSLFVLLISFPVRIAFSIKVSRIVNACLITTSAAFHILLISYFGATLSPLGAEFWAYSVTEMTNTVIAAKQVSFISVMVFLLLCLMISWLSYKVLNLDIKVNLSNRYLSVATAIMLLIVGLSAVFQLGGGISITEKEKHANKLTYFLKQGMPSLGLIKWSPEKSSFNQEYPLYRKAQNENVLGPYFEKFKTPPNIVFLLVESLGGEFVGPDGQWAGFAPYLDSLSQRSLYWKNGLSLSGRTFGFIPSLMGSLPFGRHGFMELGPEYPRHQSLISLLGKQGYNTSFYSGYDTYFDGLDFFLEHQEIDFVLNKQKLNRLLPDSKAGKNYWGFDDKTMLNFASTLLDTTDASPRLEIYHTLQSHSPFNVPDPQKYEKQFDQQLAELDLSPEQKQLYRRYRSELTALMFTDQAIESFMESYRKREYYENTIFIITGDHWLIPVPQSTAISRYHVPIIIYSPKLKEPVYFKSVNTHAEVTPTLSTFLDQQPSITMPDSVHWLSGLMDTSRQFQSKQSVPFMRNKNRISDYLDGGYYLFSDELYKLKQDLNLTQVKKDDIKHRLKNELNQFKEINNYVTGEDKLYPGKPAVKKQRYPFLVEYETLFNRIDSLDLSIDQQFQRARQMAFDNKYNMARAVAKRILLSVPEYHDVRILIGRTYAWEGNYDEAQGYFEEVLKMDSTYSDVYNAYFDSEYWADNNQKALDVINRGLKYHPEKKQFIERKIKVLSALKKYDEAQHVYNGLKKIDPDYQKLSDLRKYLTK